MSCLSGTVMQQVLKGRAQQASRHLLRELSVGLGMKVTLGVIYSNPCSAATGAEILIGPALCVLGDNPI